MVIGGGLLGLEAAKALKDLGLETHVVEFAPRLMAVQIDDAGGTHAARAHRRARAWGSTPANRPPRSSTETERAHRLRFADGSELETDLIVFSAGIRPRDELARAAGLAVGERGGIVIDDACRTSDPDIFAIGECALWKGKMYGLVAPGYQMAGIVASQLQGDSEARFAGADMSTKLKLMGVDVASIGDAHAARARRAELRHSSTSVASIYKKLVVNEDGTRLLGGILVGGADEYGTLAANGAERIAAAAESRNSC